MKLRRADGTLSRTMAVNYAVLAAAAGLEIFAADIEAAPLVGRVLLFVVTVGNLYLRSVTTQPLGSRRQ